MEPRDSKGSLYNAKIIADTANIAEVIVEDIVVDVAMLKTFKKSTKLWPILAKSWFMILNHLQNSRTWIFKNLG